MVGSLLTGTQKAKPSLGGHKMGHLPTPPFGECCRSFCREGESAREGEGISTSQYFKKIRNVLRMEVGVKQCGASGTLPYS